MDSCTCPPGCCSGNRWFKPAVIILGILIVLGLFGNIYLLLIKEKQASPIPKITPIPTQATVLATPTPDPTANWKTYKNEKYGFEIMYPPNWQIKQEFSYQDGFFISNNQDQSRVAILPNGEFDYGLPGEKSEISNITLAGKNAEQTLLNNSKIKWIKVINPPLNWSNNNRVDVNFATQEETISKILSTFKFLD